MLWKTCLIIYNTVWIILGIVLLIIGVIGYTSTALIPSFIPIDPAFIAIDILVFGAAELVTSAAGRHGLLYYDGNAKRCMLLHVVCMLCTLVVSMYLVVTMYKSSSGISIGAVVNTLFKTGFYDPLGLLDVVLGGWKFVAIFFGKIIASVLLIFYCVPQVVATGFAMMYTFKYSIPLCRSSGRADNTTVHTTVQFHV